MIIKIVEITAIAIAIAVAIHGRDIGSTCTLVVQLKLLLLLPMGRQELSPLVLRKISPLVVNNGTATTRLIVVPIVVPAVVGGGVRIRIIVVVVL